MDEKLRESVLELTNFISQIPDLKNYFNSDNTSYENQRNQITKLK